MIKLNKKIAFNLSIALIKNAGSRSFALVARTEITVTIIPTQRTPTAIITNGFRDAKSLLGSLKYADTLGAYLSSKVLGLIASNLMTPSRLFTVYLATAGIYRVS